MARMRMNDNMHYVYVFKFKKNKDDKNSLVKVGITSRGKTGMSWSRISKFENETGYSYVENSIKYSIFFGNRKDAFRRERIVHSLLRSNSAFAPKEKQEYYSGCTEVYNESAYEEAKRLIYKYC